MTRTGVPTAADLGLMQGTPSLGDALVTLANWQDPPFNRWGFQHVRDLIPTASHRPRRRPGSAAAGCTSAISRRAYGPGRGRTLRSTGSCEETYTDGLLVLHRGRVDHRALRERDDAATAHLLMSVSKSITSAVAGVLVGRGLLRRTTW